MLQRDMSPATTGDPKHALFVHFDRSFRKGERQYDQ